MGRAQELTSCAAIDRDWTVYVTKIASEVLRYMRGNTYTLLTSRLFALQASPPISIPMGDKPQQAHRQSSTASSPSLEMYINRSQYG